jgi:hypothetical protein
VHADDPESGYRFLADELHAAGHQVGERRVWRLCRIADTAGARANASAEANRVVTVPGSEPLACWGP